MKVPIAKWIGTAALTGMFLASGIGPRAQERGDIRHDIHRIHHERRLAHRLHRRERRQLSHDRYVAAAHTGARLHHDRTRIHHTRRDMHHDLGH